MKHRRFFLGVLAVAAVPFACNDFRADGGPDAVDAGQDAPLTDTFPADVHADTSSDHDVVDAPPTTEDSPPDFQCPRWTQEPRDPDCSPRRTFVLEKQTVVDSSNLRLAVGAGSVAIAYNAMLSADEGQIHVMRFPGDTVSTQALVISETQFDNVGLSLDVAAGVQGEFSLAYQTAPSNEITYRTFGLAGPATPPELVTGGIAEPSSIAVTVAPSGEARVTYSSPGQRSIFSKAKPADGTWQAASLVTTYRDNDDGGGPTSVPGAWQVSAVSDETGSTHAAFHAPRSGGHSEPRYTQLAGTIWTDSKVLDNAAGTGTSGFSIALGLAGSTHYAAFYSRPQSATVADLLLASWTGRDSTPTILRVDQNIPSESVDAPRYRVAMAIDRWGLVHLVMAHPGPGGGAIEYRRQSRHAGQVTWLSDIIDQDVVSDISGPAMVAIAISPNGRPHIAYYRASDNTVVYATRTDRSM